MATNPRMDGSSAARTRSILTRLTELQTSIDAVSAKGVAKGWIVYDQTGPTLNNSFNVDSVSDDSTGDFTITWTTDFANVNYCVVGMTRADSGVSTENLGLNDSSRAVGSCSLTNTNLSSTPVDSTVVNVVAFGDQ